MPLLVESSRDKVRYVYIWTQVVATASLITIPYSKSSAYSHFYYRDNINVVTRKFEEKYYTFVLFFYLRIGPPSHPGSLFRHVIQVGILKLTPLLLVLVGPKTEPDMDRMNLIFPVLDLLRQISIPEYSGALRLRQ